MGKAPDTGGHLEASDAAVRARGRTSPGFWLPPNARPVVKDPIGQGDCQRCSANACAGCQRLSAQIAEMEAVAAEVGRTHKREEESLRSQLAANEAEVMSIAQEHRDDRACFQGQLANQARELEVVAARIRGAQAGESNIGGRHETGPRGAAVGASRCSGRISGDANKRGERQFF